MPLSLLTIYETPKLFKVILSQNEKSTYSSNNDRILIFTTQKSENTKNSKTNHTMNKNLMHSNDVEKKNTQFVSAKIMVQGLQQLILFFVIFSFSFF